MEILMTRLFLTLSLGVLLALAPLGPAAHAQQQSSDTNETAKVKSEVARRTSDNKERVKVKLRNGSELKGRITQSSENSFTVTDEKTGSKTDIGYSDVAKLDGRGMGRGKKFGLIAGVTIVALVAIVAIGVATSDLFDDDDLIFK
jgi:small nuclear ribonucleoprotein (snRNP)-like protein